MKTCSKCKLEKAFDEFYKNKSRPDGHGNMCKPCMNDYTKGYSQTENGKRARKTAKDNTKRAIRDLIERAKSVPCADCKMEYPSYVMDFDHLGDKSFNIGNTAQRSWSLPVIAAEIAKCDVVCSNCHRIRTHNRRSDKGLKLIQ